MSLLRGGLTRALLWPIVAAIGVVALVHTPPARSYALERLRAWLASRGIDAEAESLEYSLFTLTGRVNGLSLRATGAREPFFRADEVLVDLPWSAVGGRLSLARLRTTGARLLVRRDEHGAWNLPAATRSGDGLTRLDISAIEARRTEVRVEDRAQHVDIQLAALDVSLRPERDGVAAGTIASDRLVSIAVGDRRMHLRGLTTRARYDGTSVEFSRLRADVLAVPAALPVAASQRPRSARPPPRIGASGPVRPEVGAFELAGRIDRLFASPSVAARGSGWMAFGPLAAWAGAPGSPRGRGTFDFTLDGPLGSPRASLAVRAREAEWFSLDALDLTIDATVTSEALTIDRAALARNDASLEATGRMTLGGPGSDVVHARWTAVPVRDLLAAIGIRTSVAIEGRHDGTLELVSRDGSAGLSGLELTLASSTRPAQSAAAFTASGHARLEARDGRWRVSHDHDLPRIGRLSGEAHGRLAAPIAASTLAGALRFRIGDAGSAMRQARAARVSIPESLAARVGGRVDLALALDGTIGSPRWSGELSAPALTVDRADTVSVSASARGGATAFRIDEAVVAQGSNLARVAGRVALAERTVDLRVAATFADLDAALALTQAAPSRWHPAGTLGVRGSVSGRMDRPIFTGTVEADDLELLGQRARSLSADVTLSASRISSPNLRLVQCAQGTASPAGAASEPSCAEGGELTASGDIDLARERFRLSARGRQLLVTPVRVDREPLPLRADVSALELSIEGPFAAPRGLATVDLADARWADYELGPSTFTVDLADGRGSTRFELPRLGARGTGTVGVTRPWPFATDVRLLAADLFAALPPARRQQLDATAAVDADVAVRGSLADIQSADVAATLRRMDARVSGATVMLEAPADLALGRAGIAVRHLALLSGGSRLDVNGRLGVPGDALGATFRGDLADLSPVAAALGSSTLSRMRGPVAVTLGAAGTLDRPIVEGTVRLDGGAFTVAGLPSFEDLRLQADLRDDVLHVRSAAARWQHAVIEAVATVPLATFSRWLPAWVVRTPSAPPAHLDARFANLTTSVVEPLAPPEWLTQVAAAIDGRLVAEWDASSIRATRGSLVFDRAEARIAQLPLSQTRPTRLTLDAGRLRIADWEWAGAGNTLTVSGGANLTQDGDVRLDVAADADLDLRLLGAFNRAVSTGGRARASLVASGPLREARVDGQVSIESGELRLRDPRLAVTNIEGTLVLTRGAIAIDRLSGIANGGRVDVTGEAHLAGTTVTESSIRLRGTDVGLEVPTGLRSSLAIDVSLRRSAADTALRLEGAITVLRGSYREPLSLVALVQRSRGAWAAPMTSPAAGLAAPELDITIKTRETVAVDNNYGRFDASLDLRALGTLSRPIVVGRLALAEGGEIFLGGNAYRIERGFVDFTSPTRIEPVVDIAARTRVSGVDIVLAFSGMPDALTVNLTSDSNPELGPSDLASLLVTGRRLDDVTGAESEVARDEVLNLLSGEILGFASRAVGLDTIRVGRGDPLGELRFDPSLVATETDPAARLTVSKRLGTEVEVVLSQNLRDTGGLTSIVTYRPRGSIELRYITRDNGDRTYEFRQERTSRDTARPLERARNATPRIAAIAVEADGLDAGQLRKRLALDEGDRFDFHAWQRDRERLLHACHDSGFLEARVDATQRDRPGEPGGPPAIELSYHVRSGPRTVLTVSGAAFPPEVIERMEEEWASSVYEGFLVEDLTWLAREALVGQGYVQASVRPSILSQETPARKEIVLAVDPGPHVTARVVEIQGNAAVDRSILERELSAPGLERAAWVDPQQVEEPLREAYAARGYAAARVAAGAVTIAADTARLPIVIDEGPIFLVSRVDLEGVRQLETARVLQESGLVAESPFQPAMLEEAAERVEDVYHREGFNSARAAVRSRPDVGPARMAVTLVVVEGLRQRLADIDVTGLRRTHRDLVVRALDLDLGEPVDLAEWYRARKRLYDAGVFRSADIVPEPLAPAPGVPGTAAVPEQPVRARVVLQEWPSIRARYGFQLGDERLDTGGRDLRPGVVGEIQQRNLFGRAMTAGILGRLERTLGIGRAYFSAPRFLGAPLLSSGFFGYERRVTREEAIDLVGSKATAGFEQRLRYRAISELSWSFQFERLRLRELDPDPNALFPIDFTIDVSRLLSAVVIDRRDSPFDATRGFFHSSNLEHSVPALGSSIQFSKYVLQQFHYRPLGRGMVAAGALRLGIAWRYGGDLLPSERFLAGGGSSVRGYAESSLGPLDILGESAGGAARLVLNGELRFPIYRWFRGVGFVDAGNVFERARELRLDALRVGAGGGLRLQTPFAQVRVDFGVPISTAPGPRVGRWYFSIGQMF